MFKFFRAWWQRPGVAWAMSAACAFAFIGVQVPAAESLPQVRGAFGGPSRPAALVARNPAQYRHLVRVFGARLVPPMPDFSRAFIAAVAMGRRNTGGYAVEIVGTQIRDGVAYIRYRETTPAPGTMVIQAFTAPYAIRVLPAVHAAKVMFKRECKPAVHPPFDPKSRDD